MITALLRLAGYERRSLAQPSPELLLALGAMQVSSGLSVNPHGALRCPSVLGARLVLGQTMAQLGVHLFRRGPNGRERADDYPLARVMERPTPWQSGPELRDLMVEDALLFGLAVAAIVRGADGQIAELHRLPGGSVVKMVDDVTNEPAFRFTDAGGRITDYPHHDVLHLELGGGAPVQRAREAIGLALALEQHAAKLMAKGARPAGILEYGKVLGVDAAKRLRESFANSHEGIDGSGKTLVLEDGLQYKPMTFNSVDLQFQEMRRFQLQEIARIFRVPLVLLGDLERATFANAEALGSQFATFTVLPWTRLFEAAFDRLLAPDEQGKLYVEFELDSLYRADTAARFDSYSKAISSGILSPNEVRQRENLPGYAGGDEYLRPLNMGTPSTPKEPQK